MFARPWRRETVGRLPDETRDPQARRLARANLNRVSALVAPRPAGAKLTQPPPLRVSSTAQAMGSGLEVDPPVLGSLTTQAEFAPGTLFIYLIGDYMNSPIKLPPLPELPPEIIVDEGYDGEIYMGQDEDALRAWATAYAEQAVRDALAAQVAKISAAMEAMRLDGVNGGSVQKEYFKAGARRAIQAVNSALTPENNHE